MHMRTKALVLRAVDYKESDKILTLLTQESGKLTASARGCRKKGSPVAAGVQLLAWSDLVLYEYRGRWSIREGELRQEFRHVRSDLDKLSLGAWFAELSEALTVEDVPAPEVLSLLLNSLYAMDALGKSPKLCKPVFELKMMALSGFEPDLTCCAVCGGEPEEPRLHLKQGALHCPGCRAALGEGISMPLDAACLAAMRHVLYGDPKRLFSFRLAEESLNRMSAACEAYVLTQLERGFRTLDFYKQMQEMAV